MPKQEYGSVEQQVQEAQDRIAQENSYAHAMSAVLAPLGGKVKLQGSANKSTTTGGSTCADWSSTARRA